MIRPSSLIRSESNTPRIEANAINIKKESLDCGITAMRCCNTPACQKLGTSTLFVTLLIIIGIILGASERYFQLSARQAAVELNFQPVEILDWLLVAHGIFQGIFAVVLAYWGNRIHRISWIGGILMLQSALSLAVVIPILANNDSSNMTIMAAPLNHLCTSTTSGNLTVERSYTITTLILFFILQFGIAGGNIVFFTLAFSYLDDNVLAHNSPALIGAALAARVWGWQFGSALNYGVAETSLGWWLGWAIISPTLFILAFLVSLFPKRLLTTVVRQAADNIIEVATNNSQLSLAPNKLLADISFFSSMKRMFTNKILIFNVLATVFIETAVINYFFHEKNYLQSRFLLPTDVSMSISNEWMSRTITTLLKPPIVGLMILVAGLIIAKANPSPRKIAAWNVITASIVCVLFVVYIFVECDHNYIAGGGGGGGKLMHPFCSKQCICDSNVPFSPVCPVDSVYTYFSPCHAGCSTETVLNGQRIFSNCSCGVDTMLMLNEESAVHATEGACGFTDCQQLWIIFQVLTIFGAALLGSGLIGNLIITIRCVLPQDKSLALSMELFLGGLIVYVPGKFAYQFIADEYCQYWSTDQQKCFLHESPTFGNILNIVTAALIGVSILFDILVFIFVRDLELYGEEIEDTNYRPIPMQTYASNENAPNQQASNAEELAQPLLHHQSNNLQRNSPQIDSHVYEHVTPYATIIPTNTSTSVTASPRPQQLVPNKNLTYVQVEFPSTSNGQQQENLNFRLQTINDSDTESDITMTSPNTNRAPRLFGSDINPSVGDSSDKESDANVIRQLESSVSSLSGVHESSTSPPVRNKINVENSVRQRPLSPETDF